MRLSEREAGHLNKLAQDETLWRRDGFLTLTRHTTAASGAMDALIEETYRADGAVRQIGAGNGDTPGVTT